MNLKVRPLLLSDYYRGYINLMKQLSIINDHVNFKDFKNKWFEISNNKFHKIYVIEFNNKIVASGTLIVEPKFIRNCNYAGHLEDIVVDETTRGQGFARLIINKLLDISKELNCYRVTLNCHESKFGLYSKFGFKLKSNCMRIDINEN
jgi:glucosamine-phosphate N-acetyltransferase